jgi:hypothetical protein
MIMTLQVFEGNLAITRITEIGTDMSIDITAVTDTHETVNDDLHHLLQTSHVNGKTSSPQPNARE